MKQIIENLNILRSGIFKDEKAVNDLLDATIELAEQRQETASPVDAFVMRTDVRKDDDGAVDEVLMYADERCVFHLETMSDQAIWFVMYPEEDIDEHFWINSKNGRSHIHINEQ